MEGKPLFILPVGQTEEHGSHLPLETDCVIASRIARAAAERLGQDLPAILMETISFGYSGNVMTRWPGLIRVNMDTVRDYIYDICASLVDMGANKIAVINGHGHHCALLELMARKLMDEKQVAPVILYPFGLASEALEQVGKGGTGASCHAGEFETSLMLVLDPESVEMSQAVDNPLQDADEFPPRTFWSTWDRQKTEDGIYGKPSVASADTGKILFDAAVNKAVQCLLQYHCR